MKNDTRVRWRGYTYWPFWPSWMLPVWKKMFCRIGFHLWDEVLSDYHHLYCDACGIEELLSE